METPLEQMRQILAWLSLPSSDVKHKVRVLSDPRSSFLACSQPLCYPLQAVVFVIKLVSQFHIHSFMLKFVIDLGPCKLHLCFASKGPVRLYQQRKLDELWKVKGGKMVAYFSYQCHPQSSSSARHPQLVTAEDGSIFQLLSTLPEAASRTPWGYQHRLGSVLSSKGLGPNNVGSSSELLGSNNPTSSLHFPALGW